MPVEKNREELTVPSLESLFTRLDQKKSEKGMLRFGISGSWRMTSGEVEEKVREAVRKAETVLSLAGL